MVLVLNGDGPSDSSQLLANLLNAVIASPTVLPSFEKCDVLGTLIFLGEGSEPVSRTAIMKELNLKEGPVKTLLKRLEQNNLLTRIGNKGHMLTDKGKEWNNKIRKTIVDFKEVQAAGVSLTEFAYAIQLRGISGLINSGIEQRDHALLAGGSGATTLTFETGLLKVPSVSGKVLHKKTLRGLLIEFKLEEGDILIVGMGHTRSDAQRGAFNASLSLLLRLETRNPKQ
jgi:predicted transcriptional regulator